MLRSEDEVPDCWDDEFNDGPKKIYNYDRDTLLSLQSSPLCLQKPVFFIDVPIILDIPHAGTIPIDPTKRIDIQNAILQRRLTNRPSFNNRQNLADQARFENWWSEKQAALEEVNAVTDKNAERVKEESSIEAMSDEVNEGDVSSACEEIINSCVESVLTFSDTEDDVNNNEIPPTEEKGAQDNVQDHLRFEEVRRPTYPSKNLSINMAIINRRRMSNSMRVGSSRLKRFPPPCLPSHPSVQAWGTTDIPEHLIFDQVASSVNEQISSPYQSPSKIKLVSVSKDLLIDPGKENSTSFGVSNDLSKILNNIISSIDTNHLDPYSEKVENANEKEDLADQFIDVANFNGECHSEELVSHKKETPPSDEKTYITQDSPSSKSASRGKKYFNNIQSLKATETSDNFMDLTSRTHSLYGQVGSDSNPEPSSVLNSAFKCQDYFNDALSNATSSHINGISSTESLNFAEQQVILEGDLTISQKVNKGIKNHHRNLLEEFDVPGKIQTTLVTSPQRSSNMAVENSMNGDFSSQVSQGSYQNDNHIELVDSLIIKHSLEEFVDPVSSHNSKLCNFESVDFSLKCLENIPVTSSANHDEDTDGKEDDIFYECQQDLDIEHSVNGAMEHAPQKHPVEHCNVVPNETLNETQFETPNPSQEHFISNLDLLLDSCLNLTPVVQCTGSQDEHNDLPDKSSEINKTNIEESVGNEGEDGNRNYQPPAYSSRPNKFDTLDEFDMDIRAMDSTSAEEAKVNHVISTETNKKKKSRHKHSKKTHANQQNEGQENRESSKKQEKKGPEKPKAKDPLPKVKENINTKPDVLKKKNSAGPNDKQQISKAQSNSTNNNSRLETASKKGKTEAPTSSTSMIDLTFPLSVSAVDSIRDMDENYSHEEWKCQESKKTRRKRTSSNNAQQQQQADKSISDRNRTQSESKENNPPKVTDPQQRYTPHERACVASSKSQEDSNLASTNYTCEVWRNPEVVDYCNRNNVMYILRGIPGSGKSRTAWRIKHLYQADNAYLCSADDFHINYLGQYDFQTSKLEQAHNACQERARAECLSGRNVVIIDNTNIKAEAFRYYLQLAHFNDYIVVLVDMAETDIDICFERNKHNVPRDKIAYMKSVYEEVIPFYYGWVMSISDTFELRSLTCATIHSHSTEIPGFKGFIFEQSINNIEHLFHIYNMKASSSSKNMLHVTACYTSCGQRPGSRNYARSKPVLQAVGGVCKLQVIGLCITPTSLFARVLLSEKQKLVWGNDDACNGEINRLYKQCNFELENSNLREGTKVVDNECYNAFSPNKLNERVSKMSRFIQNMGGDYLLPDFGLGCTAHITLGVVDGCTPVRSRDDLKAIICAELDGDPKLEYRFSREMIRLYEGNLWIMYFKESLFIPTMFCGAYFSEKFS